MTSLTSGLRRRPGRPPVACLSDAKNVSSVVAKDGDQTKCQKELRVLCTLLRTESERDCCGCTNTYIWSHNISFTATTLTQYKVVLSCLKYVSYFLNVHGIFLSLFKLV